MKYSQPICRESRRILLYRKRLGQITGFPVPKPSEATLWLEIFKRAKFYSKTMFRKILMKKMHNPKDRIANFQKKANMGVFFPKNLQHKSLNFSNRGLKLKVKCKLIKLELLNQTKTRNTPFWNSKKLSFPS